MRIEWDLPIEMDDGIVLRADVYLPAEEGRYRSSSATARTRRGSRSRTPTPTSGG